ncbi:MAG: hypothetical protein GXY83_27845 [Rhodopirellula sp.]|nr:hypothetical protein [Rhodopirellula sp.]
MTEAYKVLQQFHPMSLRGLHYQMVSRGVYANTPANYAKLGRAMTKARENGSIPWNWIVDNLRQTNKPSSWTGLVDFLDTVREAYRKDFWARMPAHIEIFVEKDAMAAALQPATRDYDVALHVIRGYISTSYCWTIASQWRQIEKPVYCYYLGDWDPSGLDLERSLREKLTVYSGRIPYNDYGELDSQLVKLLDNDDVISALDDGLKFHWQRLALTEFDFEEFDLLPLRIKRNKRGEFSDKRAKGFVAEHGDKCAELDAVPPDELRQRIENAIQEHIDGDEWERLQRVEQAEQETLENFIDQLPKVKLDSVSDTEGE